MRSGATLYSQIMNPTRHALLLCSAALALGSAIGLRAEGTISGTITDAKTKQPLRSVTVKITGTYYGALTNPKGEYTIKKVKAGKSYTVEISLLGYKKVKKTGVAVEDNKNTVIDIALEESSVTLDQDVVVIGNRPLVEVEETQSIRALDKNDIGAMVAENVSDVLVQVPGIVTQNNEIYIRGGRGYETGYMLDGISIQDPIAGTGLGLQMAASAVEEMEVITGGFNPEYGQATSGIINMKTRRGSDVYTGSFGYRRQSRVYGRNVWDRDTNSSFLSDIADLSLGGPEPITSQLLPALGLTIPGKMYVFGSVYANFGDYYQPEYSRRQVRSSLLPGFSTLRSDNMLSGFLKLDWNMSPTMRINYSYNRSIAINQNSRSLQTNLEFVPPAPGYQFEFQENQEGALTYGSISQLHSFTFTHNISPSTVYEVRVGNFFSRLKVDANGRDFGDYTEPRDIPGLPAEYYDTGDSTRTGIIPGDGFFDVGNGFIWNDHFLDEWTVKADLTSFISEKNKLKGGVEVRMQQMQQANIYAPWLGPLGLNNDVFRVNTSIVAAYLQNNLTFKGLVLNYGVRMDMWAPGDLVDDAIANSSLATVTESTRQSYLDKTFPLFGYRWKTRLSPRLGVSHPVTDNQTLYFNYGHFNKLPRPQFVYSKLTPQAANSTYQRFGNPDLDPETTISYEIGLKSQLTTDDVLTLTAYYKDIFDYVQTRRLVVDDPRLAGGGFQTYVNSDYARSRGLEVEYKKRIGSWFRGSAAVAYSVVTGRSSSADQGAEIARGLADERIKEDFMPWDRPLQVNLTLNVISAKGEPFLGIPGLDDVNAFMRFFFQSGMRYTPHVALTDPATGRQRLLPNGRPVYAIDEQQYLAGIGDNWWWVDLNIQKSLSIGGLKTQFTLEVLNVFDVKNSQIINPVTGHGYEYGDATPLSWNDPLYPDLQQPLSPYEFNPARYTQRRALRFGMNIVF